MNERLGIAGSGAIGSGLARAAAAHGEVVVWARSDESAARAAEETERRSRGPCGMSLEHVRRDLAEPMSLRSCASL